MPELAVHAVRLGELAGGDKGAGEEAADRHPLPKSTYATRARALTSPSPLPRARASPGCHSSSRPAGTRCPLVRLAPCRPSRPVRQFRRRDTQRPRHRHPSSIMLIAGADSSCLSLVSSAWPAKLRPAVNLSAVSIRAPTPSQVKRDSRSTAPPTNE